MKHYQEAQKDSDKSYNESIDSSFSEEDVVR